MIGPTRIEIIPLIFNRARIIVTDGFMLQDIRRLANVEVVDVVPKQEPGFPDAVEVLVTYKIFPNDRVQACWFAKLPKECACSST